ncbi:hypothetical protein KGY72_00590 [Candidatus Bipolaricaulota bacterium]|nr:hypothetical protein [Candidatus Bipolaricaulota bacterium]MBS3791503.1 hypothetical protein [Candidatus Bipolaricaulota bacterium]
MNVQKEAESEDELVFSVDVGGRSGTDHTVTVDQGTYESIAPNNIGAAELVEESFKFLLEREPKESILTKFNLTTIGDYFPEYEEKIKTRLVNRA